MARCLGACAGGDSQLQEVVAALLREQDSQMQVGGENELNSAVIEAMLLLRHRPEKQDVGVAEIDTMANTVLEKRRELIELKPRSVGDLLRHLGLATKRLGATRRGFTLLNSVRKQIHELANRYKVLHARNQSVYRTQCDELFPSEESIYHERELIRRLDAISGEELESIF